jgi:hypothetical protein
MSTYEKKISFLNRYFVYKKIRHVNTDKVLIDDEIEIYEMEKTQLEEEKKEQEKKEQEKKEQEKKEETKIPKLKQPVVKNTRKIKQKIIIEE